MGALTTAFASARTDHTPRRRDGYEGSLLSRSLDQPARHVGARVSPSSRVAVAGGHIAEYPDDSTSRDDFAIGIDSGDAPVIHERYYAEVERWGFIMSGTAVGDRPANVIDAKLLLQEPGYLPPTPTGGEEEGYSRDEWFHAQLHRPNVPRIEGLPVRMPVHSGTVRRCPRRERVKG
jgi:hypothetical protein